MASRSFNALLQDQIGAEFAAHQQYVAVAVWFDAHDLPRLAAHFYRQSVEERNHAMMIVRYMLDRDLPVQIPAVSAVRNEFTEPRDLALLSLNQELEVTRQIEVLFRAARADNDVIGEQFMLWFLKEQVEEVSSMRTLLTIIDRAGDDYFKVEDFLARERVGDGGQDGQAPEAAGGVL
jgi:ferritin